MLSSLTVSKLTTGSESCCDLSSISVCICHSESGTVSIMGGNVTVVQDQQVEFQCLASAWLPSPTVSWTRNGEAVSTNLYNTTSMADGNYYNSTSPEFPGSQQHQSGVLGHSADATRTKVQLRLLGGW